MYIPCILGGKRSATAGPNCRTGGEQVVVAVRDISPNLRPNVEVQHNQQRGNLVALE